MFLPKCQVIGSVDLFSQTYLQDFAVISLTYLSHWKLHFSFFNAKHGIDENLSVHLNTEKVFAGTPKCIQQSSAFPLNNFLCFGGLSSKDDDNNESSVIPYNACWCITTWCINPHFLLQMQNVFVYNHHAAKAQQWLCAVACGNLAKVDPIFSLCSISGVIWLWAWAAKVNKREGITK